jgi:hypothetical protein
MIDNDPEQNAMLLINFMKYYGDIMSPQERRDNDARLSQERVIKKYEKWRDISISESRRKMFLWKYCDRIKQSMNISPGETDQLFDIINNGIALKILQSEDFVVQNAEVSHIDNIGYDVENRRFFFIRGLTERNKIKNLHFVDITTDLLLKDNEDAPAIRALTTRNKSAETTHMNS